MQREGDTVSKRARKTISAAAAGGEETALVKAREEEVAVAEPQDERMLTQPRS